MIHIKQQAKINFISSWAVEELRIIFTALEVIKFIFVVLYVSLNDEPYKTVAFYIYKKREGNLFILKPTALTIYD